MSQEQIIEEARTILKKDYGIDVVCLDSLKNGITDDAVEAIVLDTLYWEGLFP